MKRRARKPKQPKRITYEIIEPKTPTGEIMYRLLDRLVKNHHHELSNAHARIALAWCTSWKADVDGRVKLGMCKKASDLDRELSPFDFVILLSRQFWTNTSVTEQQKTALLDHELMHASVKADTTNRDEIAHDERGRPIFRIRKHDIEEFQDVVARHGTYKRELERFAQALRRAPLLRKAEKEEAKQKAGPKRISKPNGGADSPATM